MWRPTSNHSLTPVEVTMNAKPLCLSAATLVAIVASLAASPAAWAVGCPADHDKLVQARTKPGKPHWRRPDPPRRKFFRRLQFASERFLRAHDALPKSVKILPKFSIHFPESRFISALRPNEGKKCRSVGL